MPSHNKKNVSPSCSRPIHASQAHLANLSHVASVRRIFPCYTQLPFMRCFLFLSAGLWARRFSPMPSLSLSLSLPGGGPGSCPKPRPHVRPWSPGVCSLKEQVSSLSLSPCRSFRAFLKHFCVHHPGSACLRGEDNRNTFQCACGTMTWGPTFAASFRIFRLAPCRSSHKKPSVCRQGALLPLCSGWRAPLP